MVTTLPAGRSPSRRRRGWWGGFLIAAAPAMAVQEASLANFTSSSYSVLLDEAKGAIPHAFGPVKATVSDDLTLSLQFSIVKGKGYAAGTVTATADSTGRLTTLVKLPLACAVSYASNGAFRRVTCTDKAPGRRALVRSAADVDVAELYGEESGATGGIEPAMDGAHASRRRLSDCSSCLAAVNAAFSSSGLGAVCGAPFGRLVPAPHPWAKAAAVALCAMTTRLGTPRDVAYRACRCSCEFNSECPPFKCMDGQCKPRFCSGRPEKTCPAVCSDGFCLAQKLDDGQACPDADDDDCSNESCARDAFPSGPYVCCPSGGMVEATDGNYAGEWYCTGQKARSPCFTNAMCESGVCSSGACLDQRLDVGEPCPDAENEDCLNERCARGSYPAGDHICCPTGLSGVIPDDSKYCAGIQEAGAACETDWMCSSGGCYDGVCLGSCAEDDSTCVSGGYCWDGVCMPSFECVDGFNQECRCGRSSYPSGEYICCHDRRIPDAEADGSPDFDVYDFYCPRTQSLGSACVNDWMCKDGVCVDRVCEASEVLQTCPVGVYARESYPSGDVVCCSGGAVSTNVIDTFGKWYCAGSQTVGSACDANAMCASGVCSGLVCREEKLSDGEPCDFVYRRLRSTGDCYWDRTCADCLSGFCAKASFPSARNVCCGNGTVLSYTFEAYYCAGTQEIGSPCDRNELCSSGVCSVHRATKCDIGAACARGVCLEGAGLLSNASSSGNTSEVQDQRGLPPWGRPTGGGVYPYLAVVDWTYSFFPVYDKDNWKDVEPRWHGSAIQCHGALLAPDVVLSTCYPYRMNVMVGDSYSNESVQFRKVLAVSEVQVALTDPGNALKMLKIETVDLSGFYSAAINKDPDAVFVGQSLTAVGYNQAVQGMAPWYDGYTDEQRGRYLEGEVYESPLIVSEVGHTSFKAKQLVMIGPCSGRGRAPVFDSSNLLVGFGKNVNCLDINDQEKEKNFIDPPPMPSDFVRVSHAADWIERSLCAISESREAFSFCPPLVCPFDAYILGYPWALLPNGTGSVFGIHGFEPVRVVQWPPPGTPLWFNTTTNVTITATDASERVLECIWHVHVPPLVQVGQISFDVHTNSKSTVIVQSKVGGSGRIFKMTGRLSEHLRGAGSARARVQKGHDKTSGSLRLDATRKQGAIAFPSLDVRFTNFEVSDTKLEIQTKRVTKAVTIEYKLYGQIQL